MAGFWINFDSRVNGFPDRLIADYERGKNSNQYMAKKIWLVSGQLRFVSVLFFSLQPCLIFFLFLFSFSIYYWPRISVRRSLFIVTFPKSTGKSKKLMMSEGDLIIPRFMVRYTLEWRLQASYDCTLSSLGRCP